MQAGKAHAPGASPAEDVRCADGESPLRILIAAAEYSPLTRESMIAGFAASISNAIRALGHDIRAVVPHHGTGDSTRPGTPDPLHRLDVPMLDSPCPARVFENGSPDGVPVLTIENARYFGRGAVQGYADDDERYVFFSKAIVEFLGVSSWKPDVVHCVEWHTALVPDYLRDARETQNTHTPACVLTLCDLERYSPSTFRGRTEMDSPQLTLNLAARGILAADRISVNAEENAVVVSRLELLAPFLREQSRRVACIDSPASAASEGTGVPSAPSGSAPNPRPDPMTDPAIHTAFGPASRHRKARNKQALQLVRGLELRADAPLIAIICPLDEVNNVAMVHAALGAVAALGAQIAAQGRGEEGYERLLARAADASPSSVSFRRAPPDATGDSARRLLAAADILLAPGRDQSAVPIALRYGVVPIAPCAPTDSPMASFGFSFDPSVPGSLPGAMRTAIREYRAPARWDVLVYGALSLDPAWQHTAGRYLHLYRTTFDPACESTTRSIDADSPLDMRAF